VSKSRSFDLPSRFLPEPLRQRSLWVEKQAARCRSMGKERREEVLEIVRLACAGSPEDQIRLIAAVAADSRRHVLLGRLVVDIKAARAERGIVDALRDRSQPICRPERQCPFVFFCGRGCGNDLR
jgi:hypothetical protein